MKLIAIYDDRAAVPDEARGFLGVSRFAQLVFRKRTLREHARVLLTAAGVERIITLDGDDELARVLDGRGNPFAGCRVLYMPSSLAVRDAEAARIFLRKLSYSDDLFALLPEGESSAPPLLAMDAKTAARVLSAEPARWRQTLRESPDQFLSLPNHAELVDLTIRERLMDFISSTFDARAFNAIEQDSLLVTKRSADVTKMRREFRFYEQLDGPLRLFFLQPLSFREADGQASYQTERLCVPDLAVQWIHRAFDAEAFALFLGKLKRFVALRPVRAAPDDRAQTELYLGKIDARLKQLSAHPAFAAVEATLRHGAPSCLPATLAERFRARWNALRSRRRAARQAVSHGDLCFSNILYHRESRLMKFIDPRGAESPEELFLDEHYDLAKLSHSVLGLYDFINHDLCELRLNRDLSLSLDLDTSGLEPLQDQFRAMLRELGHDVALVRLAEASLFISMLPLHVDVPKKVVAFALTAGRILDALERDPDSA